MFWYYLNANSEQVGPIAEAEFNALVKAGAVTPETMVWKEGLAAWMTYSEAVPRASAAAVAVAGMPAIAQTTGGAPGDTARCMECGKTFARADMVDFAGTLVCAGCKPIYVQKLREGAPLGSENAWRYKKVVITRLNGVLPQRCVKCNEATTSPQMKRQLRWVPPYFMLLGGLLASLLAKRTTVFVSMCEKHRSARRSAIVLSWVMILFGIGFIVGGISTSGTTGGSSSMSAILSLAGFVIFFVGMMMGLIRSRIVYPAKITKEYVWLTGCKRPFLESLTDWTGPK